MVMRSRWAGMVLGMVLLAGCDVPPEGTGLEDVAKFQAAVASIGCELRGEGDYLPVELQTGLTRQQSTDMAGYHLATDQAERLEDGTVRLKVGPCAGAAA